MPTWLKIALGFLVLILLMQLIPVDRSVPETDPQADFLTYANTPEMFATAIKSACYDCHSYETKYPWYAKVAPVSFWIQHHIEEGREHLNFNTWTSYPQDRQHHKMEEIVEEIKEGHMPLPSYLGRHPEAEWTEEQKNQLIDYFTQWEEALR